MARWNADAAKTGINSETVDTHLSMCHLWGRPHLMEMCHPQRVASSAATVVVPVMQTIGATASATKPMQLLHSERGRKDTSFVTDLSTNGSIMGQYIHSTDFKPMFPLG